ncbi:unnamed protein product [Callosobruchus maculatus]|uniref:Uncharacterized protein n=1 Tax=Callosobruchus maculatus TaxID=64391 RepID=A0A653BM68_CALMS|nr:unnamed protein product [Callosobruchus maculatus]
MTAEVTSDVSL